jgi:hypothetical protein
MGRIDQASIAASWNSIGPPIITNPVAASRPVLKPGSRRFAPRGSATAIGASILLRHKGWETNLKKIHRIYNELGLQLRSKTPKRTAW